MLWWGNVIEKGNELDCWYPLLPRRISNADINPFNADWEPEEIEDDGYDDIFDTCPECGCGISLRMMVAMVFALIVLGNIRRHFG